jgi:type I restriction enzyme S subunit
MRLHVRDGVNKRWLYYALNSPATRAQMSAVATGTKDSMRNISQEKVRQLTIRVPDEGEQRKIVEQVERDLSILDSVKATVDRALVQCGQLRRSILERAFTGRLVPQDPDDEPASVLLERIRAERAAAPKPARTPRQPRR